MSKTEYIVDTFGELFESIAFDYEPQYPPYIGKNFVTFFKTTIYKDGKVERKGTYHLWNTNNPTIWPRVLQLAEMLKETPAEKVLYGQGSKDSR